MEEHNLGPNGGLVFCMESLLVNFDWLEEKLSELDTHYVIFDCPGQVYRTVHSIISFQTDEIIRWNYTRTIHVCKI
jgi:hypothetical protein